MLQLFQVCTQGPFSFHLGDETRKFRENLLTVGFGTRIYRRPQIRGSCQNCDTNASQRLPLPRGVFLSGDSKQLA